MEFDLQNLIASVGFPITLSMYLLVRIEGKQQNLSDSINELSNNIKSMNYIKECILKQNLHSFVVK